MARPILRMVKSWNTSVISIRKASYAITYQEFGEPNKVLSKTEIDVKSDLDNQEVHIKMLAAPINPADINMIQGTYAIKPDLPAVGGNEGVGQVVKVGAGVTSLKVGSWVIPSQAGWGTWRTDYVCHEDDLIEVANDLPLPSAATMSVNPCTAYRMLVDFEKLSPGDSVIQNGANSGVGQSVIQIAKHMGLKTINVVRKRPDLEELKGKLQALGADAIVTENELRTPALADTVFKNMPRPKLALNCVGGPFTTDMLRYIAYRGTMVTYGGMSRQPVTVPVGVLIFRDVTFRGYWMSQWSKDNAHSTERKNMIDYIAGLVKSDALKTPCIKYVPFDDYDSGIQRAMEPFISQKHLLVMDEKYLKYPYTIDQAVRQ